MNEREELEWENKDRSKGRAEAVTEATRLLPMARGWICVAIMEDGNPAVMSHLPQYADAVCCRDVVLGVINMHLSKSFNFGPTQGI